MNVDTASHSEQRKFGLIMAGAFAVLGAARWGIHWWRLGEMPGLPYILWGIAAAFLALAVVWPRGLRPIFAGWMRLALAMNWLVTHVVLTLAFFLVMLPTALIMRALAHDPLKRAWNRSAETYWEPAEDQPEGYEPYLNQF